MAHRFNCQTGRKEPKKHASERTWYRWRMRNDIETKQDVDRFNKHGEVKTKIKEAFLSKLSTLEEPLTIPLDFLSLVFRGFRK